MLKVTTMGTLSDFDRFFKDKGIYLFLHLCVLALSLFLIYDISVDTFNGIDFYEQEKFMHVQFWICLGFMADFFIEFFLSPNKWHYIKTRFIFFLVAIPYQAILFHFHFTFNILNEVLYIIRYMPLIRGGYALAIVVGWLTYSRAAGLFFTYIIILFSTVYFASLTFYLFEHTANPLVKSYHDAIWWAAMDVTTVGSNIVAVTTVGRVLSVLLAAMGMMMFPIFTVYITNLITRHNKEGESNENVLLIPRKIYHHSRNKEAEDTTDETNDASASASSTGEAPKS